MYASGVFVLTLSLGGGLRIPLSLGGFNCLRDVLPNLRHIGLELCERRESTLDFYAVTDVYLIGDGVEP